MGDPSVPAKRCFRNGKLSSEEKFTAVQRVQNGETKAAVARDLNIPESTLRGWFKNADKIQFLLERESITKRILHKSSTKMPSTGLTQSNHFNEWQTLQNNSSSGNIGSSPSGVMDLTVSPELQKKPQCYGFINNNHSSESAPLKNQSSLSSSPIPFHNSQSNGRPWTQNVDTPTNTSVKGPNSFFHPMSGNSSSNISVPKSPAPTTLHTPGSIYDKQQSMLLWQLHDFNQAVIERIVHSSPSATRNDTSFNFRLPEGLNISPNPSVQPIENSNPSSVRLSISKLSPKSEPIINRKEDGTSGDQLPQPDQPDNNNNNNNNIVADNKENRTEIIDASEAVKYAEKFSKWFQTYSDPTLTHQDVLRFEQLLGKVRKIVERRNNGTGVQNLKIRRRK